MRIKCINAGDRVIFRMSTPEQAQKRPEFADLDTETYVITSYAKEVSEEAGNYVLKFFPNRVKEIKSKELTRYASASD